MCEYGDLTQLSEAVHFTEDSRSVPARKSAGKSDSKQQSCNLKSDKGLGWLGYTGLLTNIDAE